MSPGHKSPSRPSVLSTSIFPSQHFSACCLLDGCHDIRFADCQRGCLPTDACRRLQKGKHRACCRQRNTLDPCSCGSRGRLSPQRCSPCPADQPRLAHRVPRWGLHHAAAATHLKELTRQLRGGLVVQIVEISLCVGGYSHWAMAPSIQGYKFTKLQREGTRSPVLLH